MYASYGTSWRARGDHSPRATPRQPFALFLYSRASLMSSSIWLALFVVLSRWRLYWNVFSSLCSLSLSLSLSLLFLCLVSDGSLCSRLCRRSALVSTSGLLSSLLSTSLRLCFCLISASATPLARRVRLLHWLSAFHGRIWEICPIAKERRLTWIIIIDRYNRLLTLVLQL